ncbi:MAG: AP protein [Acidobacteriota bacterium]|nr:AP protein [Acidobacteriota bacterium]
MQKQRLHCSFACSIAIGLLLAGTCAGQNSSRKTQNIIFVMTDGLRWQDVFSGADTALMNKESGVSNLEGVRREFWRETPQARREALLPFLWGEIAKRGQIYGNRELGSNADVTNTMNFSYPGYNETLSGFADDARIHSNDKLPNPNVTVLEWLNRKPSFAGKVAAFGSWDVFPFILNAGRSGLMVNAGYEPLTAAPVTPKIELLNRLKTETGMWEGEPFDGVTFHTALEYYKLHKPRVLFLSLGDTDEWAHARKYELYLRSAHRFDQYVKELWDTAQSMPETRGNTALILAVDHGRGLAPVDWRSHGQKLPDTKSIWMAFLGPDTPGMGERSKVEGVTQSQIAATLAALLGEDYNAAVEKAGKPVRDVLHR